MAIRVAGIVGSLRDGSLNKGLLHAAVELAPAGMEINIYTRLGDIPPYNDDVFQKGDPPPVADFKAFLSGADAILISTPEYNYGVPGVLKNAIDWASRPAGKSVLNRKPAAIMGCSPGLGGTIRAQHAHSPIFCLHRNLRHAPARDQNSLRGAVVRCVGQTHRRKYPPVYQEISRRFCDLDRTIQRLAHCNS